METETQHRGRLESVYRLATAIAVVLAIAAVWVNGTPFFHGLDALTPRRMLAVALLAYLAAFWVRWVSTTLAHIRRTWFRQ